MHQLTGVIARSRLRKLRGIEGMPEEEPVIAHGNEVFRIEIRGFDHIPESERNMSLRQVDDIWVGTSVNLFSFALGAAICAPEIR